MKPKDVAANSMDTKERRLRTFRLNRDQRGPHRRPSTVAENMHELLDRASLEQGCNRQVRIKLPGNKSHQLRSQQRVTTQLKEIMPHANRANAEHIFPDLDHLGLGFISRRHKSLCGRQLELLRCGERPPVDLAIRR